YWRDWSSDVCSSDLSICDGVGDASDDRLSVRTRPCPVKRIRHLATTLYYAQDFRTARLCGLVALKHQRPGTFSHDKTVAIFRKRFCCRMRDIVAGGKC